MIDKINDTTIHVTGNSDDEQYYYTLDAPVEKFNYTGKKFIIHKYGVFKQYFAAIQAADKTKLPVLRTENDANNEPCTLIISQPELNNATLRLDLASLDGTIKPLLYNEESDDYHEIELSQISAKFSLADTQLTYLQKMAGLTCAEKVQFSVSEGICSITCMNSKTSDIFSQNYAVDSDSTNDNFELVISAECLNRLPTSAYTLELDKAGLVHFKQERTDGINVNFYITALEG